MPINGEKLKKLRESFGLTPGRVADELGVSRQAYLKYENGITRQPRKLDEIALLFNVTPDYLLDYDDRPKALLSEEESKSIKTNRKARTLSKEDEGFLKKLHALDKRGRDIVLSVLNREYDYAEPLNTQAVS